MGRPRFVRSALALVVTLASACGSDEESTAQNMIDDAPAVDGWPPATGQPSAPRPGYDGDWRGMTSQGLPIGFTIGEAGVSRLQISWRLPGCDWNTTVRFERPLAIEDGSLTAQLDMEPGDVTTAVILNFLAPGTAYGKLSFEAASVPDIPSCVGQGGATFSATKG